MIPTHLTYIPVRVQHRDREYMTFRVGSADGLEAVSWRYSKNQMSQKRPFLEENHRLPLTKKDESVQRFSVMLICSVKSKDHHFH